MLPLPQNMAEIQIPDQFADIVAVNQLREDKRMIVLASRAMLTKLKACETIFADGTFKTCPRMFRQVYIFRGEDSEGHRHNLVFALMPDRSTEAYNWLFRKIKTRVMEVTSGEFKPKIVMTDFEEAVFVAIRQELHQTLNKGWYFRLMKAFFRKLASLGLTV